MKFKRGLGILTIAAITTAPVAAVISCGSEAAPLNMEGAKVAEKTIVNPFQLNCMPFADGNSLFSDEQLKTFQSNLLKDLYYGPEAWDLKSITLDPGHITSGSQLGVYYPASKQIFINISDYEGAIAKGKYTIDEVYKVIEKVIAHEYGHHFFATYANGYLKGDDAVHEYSNKYVYDNAGDPRYKSNWNEDYFNDFRTEYSMDNDTVQTPKPYQHDNIDSVFSLKDLFDNANAKGGELKWGTHTKVTYGTSVNNIAGTAASYAVAVDKDNQDSLKYIYSMDEQVTRKMQMMFYPSEIDSNRYTFDNSLLKISAGKSSYFDPYAVDWMRTADLSSSMSSVKKAHIYPDDIFQSFDGKTETPDKVDKAYAELLHLMGYDMEISHMYSANDAKVSSPSSVVGLTKSNDNHVKLTGFVDQGSKFDRIVDKDGILITNIQVQNDSSRFHFMHKATWNANVAKEGPKNDIDGNPYATNKVPYTTDEFYVANFSGKQLFFQEGEDRSTAKAITKINQDSLNETNVNSYDSQRPSDTYYQIVSNGAKTEVRRYQ